MHERKNVIKAYLQLSQSVRCIAAMLLYGYQMKEINSEQEPIKDNDKTGAAV
jgi:hypothetical protein